MPWERPAEPATPADEAFAKLTLDDLRPLAGLVAADPPKRKTELVPLLAGVMTDPARVRGLYDQLDPTERDAVRVAAHDPRGRLDRVKFAARYGRRPPFDDHPDDDDDDEAPYRYGRPARRPGLLRLFLPRYDWMPTDVREIVRAFAPPPEPFAVPAADAPPQTHTRTSYSWKGGREVREEQEEPVRVRETAREAEDDVRAVLRLIDAGRVRVTDKKRTPTEAARQAVAGVLAGGDFYGPGDHEDEKWDPAADLSVKSFAWPVLVQAGGLAERAGDALRLTAAGRKALAAEPAGTLRKLWAAWLKTRDFDEFARVDAIKGQGRARMSAAAGRRAAVREGLKECPPGRWVAVDDFWRLLRATGRDFDVAHSPDALYIAEHYYGTLGYDSEHAWEQLQGRFIVAFLFEYAATLGLIDVAYVPPQDVRDDFRDRWGADEFSCLSRYDGLLALRLNPLGAWCLGLADRYEPAARPVPEGLRVLPNLDVVASGPLRGADRLTLERFAEPASEGVWKLSATKALGVVEAGGRLDELEEFLAGASGEGLPATVETFLDDLRRRAGMLRDAGSARLIECADEYVAAELAADRQLQGKCVRAGERLIVVREADVAAVRKAVRRLGYAWPVPPP